MPQQKVPRFLVVDDDRDCADATCELLRISCECEVDVAYHPLDALVKAVAVHPDIVLLDMEMPGMDGFEAARCLLQLMPSNMPRLVALTGNAALQQQAAGDPRFVGSWMKPANLSLLALIEGYLPAEA